MKVGIETDRGVWVQAVVAAGYEVFAINPMSVARYRERHSTSGAKSDAGDAHVLAEIVRLDRAHHRPIVGDSELGEAVKLVARSHQSLVWDRTRQVLRLRGVLREFFPAALVAFADLAAGDSLELLAAAPDPDAGGPVVEGEDRRGVTASEASRSRRQGGGYLRGAAHPSVAAARRGPNRVRRDRGQPGPADHDIERRDRRTGAGGR